jgi:hypothetical protein
MNSLSQNQNPERHSREEHLGSRHDYLIEIIRLFQQLHIADTLSQERFKELIQEFKKRMLSKNLEQPENLFAGLNKDYLTKIMKNIGYFY